MRISEDQRFLTKIDFDFDTGCWNWAAGKNSTGYGLFTPTHNKKQSSHRWAYERYVGKIPMGILVRHRCDNPPCCNPDHLVLGTYSDNSRDTVTRGRDNNFQRMKKACYLGHSYAENPPYINSKGSRVCKLCQKRRKDNCKQNAKYTSNIWQPKGAYNGNQGQKTKKPGKKGIFGS
jgi:hypothetical protein